MRESSAAAARERERGGRERQPRSSPSTSPGSGKRRTSSFEKTSVPSLTTSNCPFLPALIEASNPLSFNSAARLAARTS